MDLCGCVIEQDKDMQGAEYGLTKREKYLLLIIIIYYEEKKRELKRRPT